MKRRITIGATLLLLALSLVFGFALRPHAHAATAAGKPFNLFPLEHHVGKPGHFATHALTLSCKGWRFINVTENVKNDADSGQAGNYWALDTFSRNIQVYNDGADQYCAVVTYNGSFAAVKGQQSPGSTATTGGKLSGEEVGTMKGGYTMLITGALHLADHINWPFSGTVNGGNPTDYKCTIASNGSATCPGYLDWLTKYFDTSISGSTTITNFSATQPTWGWTYVGHDAGTSTSAGNWVNASTGNSGDILDVD